MALRIDESKNKTIFFTGNPNGSVKGIIGDKLVDKKNKNEYKAVANYEGDTIWNKTMSNGVNVETPLITTQNLIEKLNISVGDSFLLSDRLNAKYNCILDSIPQYVTLKNDRINLEQRIIPQTVNHLNVLNIGDSVELVLRYKDVNDLLDGGGFLRALGINDLSTGIILRRTGNSVQVRPFGNVTTKVYNENNELVDSYIPPNEWFRVVCTMTSQITLNSNGVYIGAYILNSKFDVKEFKILGETFIKNPQANNFLGSNNSIYQLTDVDNDNGVELPVFQNDEIFSNLEYIITNDNRILKLDLSKSEYYPESIGYNSSINADLNTTNDCTQYSQRIIDLKLTLLFGGANYLHKNSVYIKYSNEIRGKGENGFTVSLPSEDPEIDYRTNKSHSVIYTDQNIDIFVWQSEQITVKNILTSTRLINNYNKSHHLFDLLGHGVRGGGMKNCRGEKLGGIANLQPIADSGNFIRFNLDEDRTPYYNSSSFARGYASYMNFEDIRCRNIEKLFVVPEKHNTWQTPANFINTFSCINVNGDGCKMIYDVKGVDNSVFISNKCQDRVVLLEGEQDTFPFYLDCTSSQIDTFMYDRNSLSDTGVAPYRHSNKWLYCPQPTSNIIGLQAKLPYFSKYNEDTKNINKEGDISIKTDIVITGGIGLKKALALPNNYIEYAGIENTVSYKGYTAPDETWFNNNLNNADIGVNSLSEDTINVNITSQGLLRGQYVNRQDLHTVKTPLSFAEVVIPLNFITKFTRIIASLSNINNNKIQLILDNSDSSQDVFWIKNLPIGSGDVNLFSEGFTNQVQTIRIRFIGGKSNSSATEIKDLFAVASNNTRRPVVDRQANQKLLGWLDLPELRINGVNIKQNGNQNELPSTPSLNQSYYHTDLDLLITFGNSFWTYSGYRVIGTKAERPKQTPENFKYYDTTTDSVVILNGQGNKIGSTLDLSGNYIYNSLPADVKNKSSFSIENPVTGNSSRVVVQYTQAEIDALTNSKPSFTGFTVNEVSSSEALIADTEMYMIVWCDNDTQGSEIINMKIISK